MLMRICTASIFLCLISAVPARSQISGNIVIEYHNTLLDHYFLAILPKEIAAVDGGKAGPNWVRTGQTFYVEDYALWDYGTLVYRFYGSPVVGPNSHFYTNNIVEYQGLLQLLATTPPGTARWNFEGEAFPAGEIIGDQCKVPEVYRVLVYRLYNNGISRGIDPNHRYTKSLAIVNEMIGKGWIFEGPVFCVEQ
jgi:serine protease